MLLTPTARLDFWIAIVYIYCEAINVCYIVFSVVIHSTRSSRSSWCAYSCSWLIVEMNSLLTCNHISFLLIYCNRRDIFPFMFHPFTNIFPLVHLPPIQLYDLGSPAESSNTLPGCAPVDERCSDAEQLPSCGKRGRCHSSRGSFSCLCEPGFTGPTCDQGERLERLKNYF